MLDEETAFFEVEEKWKTDFLEDVSFAITSRNSPSEVSNCLALLNELDIGWQRAATSGIKKAANKNGNTELKAVIDNISDEKSADIALQQLTAYYAE
jgi:hypothetical protein